MPNMFKLACPRQTGDLSVCDRTVYGRGAQSEQPPVFSIRTDFTGINNQELWVLIRFLGGDEAKRTFFHAVMKGERSRRGRVDDEF